MLSEASNAVSIITKNVLLLRDLDVIADMAKRSLVHVMITITSLDEELVRKLEPRTPTPAARLEAVRRLTAAGVPVGVMQAPIIPGLTDWETPRILEAASKAGAVTADFVVLRLPLTVKPIFLGWLNDHFPEKVSKVEAALRNVRNGELSSATFGDRMRGTGAYAKQIETGFAVFAKKFGLSGDFPPLDESLFRKKNPRYHQPSLF